MFLEFIEKNGASWVLELISFFVLAIIFLLSVILQNLKSKLLSYDKRIDFCQHNFEMAKNDLQNRIHTLEIQQKGYEVELKEMLKHFDRIESQLKDIRGELGTLLDKIILFLPNH